MEPKFIGVLLLAMAVQSANIVKPEGQPKVLFTGSIDTMSRATSVTGGQANKPQVYASLQDALVGEKFSPSDAERAVRILAEAAFIEFGSNIGPVSSPVPEFMGEKASVAFRKDGERFSFVGFDRAGPQEACKKISENCFSCGDGTIRCNVPKPKT